MKGSPSERGDKLRRLIKELEESIASMPEEEKITDEQLQLVQSDDLPILMRFGPKLAHLEKVETWKGLMQICYIWCQEISEIINKEVAVRLVNWFKKVIADKLRKRQTGEEQSPGDAEEIDVFLVGHCKASEPFISREKLTIIPAVLSNILLYSSYGCYLDSAAILDICSGKMKPVSLEFNNIGRIQIDTSCEIFEENHNASLLANEQRQNHEDEDNDIPTITLRPMNLSDRSLLEFKVLEDMIRHTPVSVDGPRCIVIPYMETDDTPVLPKEEVPLSAICGVLSIVGLCMREKNKPTSGNKHECI